MAATRAEAVVIGASAGALEALSVILPSLSSQFRLPMIVVVHVPPDKKSVLAEVLQAKCRLKVCEAEDKEPLVGGTIYLAPPNYHLLVERNKTLSLSNEEPVLYSRPSVDVLFESAADAFGPELVAIVLTGANEDGAAGARTVAREGGTVIIQRPDTAFAAAMPDAAIALCPQAFILTLREISAYLQAFAEA